MVFMHIILGAQKDLEIVRALKRTHLLTFVGIPCYFQTFFEISGDVLVSHYRWFDSKDQRCFSFSWVNLFHGSSDFRGEVGL